MKPWPQQHKKLGANALVLTAVCIAFYAFVLHPKQKAVSAIEAEVDSLQSQLLAKGWPLESNRLESLHREKAKELERFAGQFQSVLQQATSMFDARANRFFPNPDDFRNEITRLDYREEFIQTERDFEAQDVILADEILGLGENTDAAHTYQLMLKLWTMQALIDLALQHNLSPTKNPAVKVAMENGREVQASNVTILPMKSYVANADDKEPYLLEFPLRMIVRGKLTDFCRFLTALQESGNFLPISNMELRKVEPSRNLPALDLIEADIQCSSFYRFKEPAAKPRVKDVRALPPGA